MEELAVPQRMSSQALRGPETPDDRNLGSSDKPAVGGFVCIRMPFVACTELSQRVESTLNILQLCSWNKLCGSCKSGNKHPAASWCGSNSVAQPPSLSVSIQSMNCNEF